VRNLKKDIVVLGAGSYGTALSLHWHKMQKSVALIPRLSEQADSITKDQENKRYLDGINLNGLPVVFDYSLCLNAKVIVIAIPSQEYRNFLPKIVPFIDKESTIVIASKGIDIKTNSFLKDVVGEFCANNVAIWSGPQFAKEVANLLPSAVTLASDNKDVLEKLVPLLSTHTLRVYPTEDVISVQLSGALKNVIALACGIARGKNL
jgi:glycerol-3-phosphate dehydrogenase (NAD(P)+)